MRRSMYLDKYGGEIYSMILHGSSDIISWRQHLSNMGLNKIRMWNRLLNSLACIRRNIKLPGMYGGVIIARKHTR